MPPKISVCLPTYNRAAYLRQTIASLLAQTFDDFELIVADNCSSDATPETVASFADARIRYVRRPENIGHYRNMTAAIELSRGAYVCIAHDDDIYAPDFLRRECEALDEHPNVGMVHCAVRVVDPNLEPIRVHRVSSHSRIARGLDEFQRYLEGHDVCCSTVMCRREIWIDAGAFEHRLMCADWLMWLNIALRTDIAYLDSPLVDMRTHPSSMTSTMHAMRWHDEFVELTELAMAELCRRHPQFTSSLDRLRRESSDRQSRRFLIAALAAAASGEREHVEAFREVLRRLQQRGASSVYLRLANMLTADNVQPVMRAARAIRRRIARAGAGR